MERGYDAIGATSLLTAMRYPERDPDRGPVRLLILDQSALDSPVLLERLRAHHPGCRTLLIAPGGSPTPPGHWDLLLHRPISVGDVATAAESLLKQD